MIWFHLDLNGFHLPTHCPACYQMAIQSGIVSGNLSTTIALDTKLPADPESAEARTGKTVTDTSILRRT